MTIASGTIAPIVLIVVGFVIDILMILLLVRRSRRARTAQKRTDSPWPLAVLLVLGFVAILAGAGALR